MGQQTVQQTVQQAVQQAGQQAAVQQAGRLPGAGGGRGPVAGHRGPGRAPVPGRPRRGPQLLAARPDAIVVEMGLPVWRPPAGGYVATYGAARTSGQTAAVVLGFACR